MCYNSGPKRGVVSRETIYRVSFISQGEVYEVYARNVSQGGLFGFIEIEQLRNARGIEARDRDPVRFGDLVRIGSENDAVASPYDDRCDAKARARGVVVEQAKHTVGLAGQSHLLVKLSQCGTRRVFTLVDAPAGKRPLTAMIAERRHSAGNDEASLPGLVSHDGHGHRGGRQRGVALDGTLVPSEILHDSRTQTVIDPKRHDLGILPIAERCTAHPPETHASNPRPMLE